MATEPVVVIRTPPASIGPTVPAGWDGVPEEVVRWGSGSLSGYNLTLVGGRRRIRGRPGGACAIVSRPERDPDRLWRSANDDLRAGRLDRAEATLRRLLELHPAMED